MDIPLLIDKGWVKKINITKEEHDTISNLLNNKDIGTKLSQGNSAILFNRHNFITCINDMLSDTSEFRNINIKSWKEIHCLLQTDDNLSVKNYSTTILYKDSYPKGSQPGVMYGLHIFKIH